MNKADIYAKLSVQTDLPFGSQIDLQANGNEAESYLRDVYQRFLSFSTVVTAYTQFDLQGTGQGEAYFATLVRIVGFEVLEQLLEVFEVVEREANGSKQTRHHLLRQQLFGDEKLGPVARNIVKLWFSGNWYQLPRNWHEKFGPVPADITFTVSGNAYVEGLLWTTIGAHPAGAKAPGYGSWASPPVIPPVA